MSYIVLFFLIISGYIVFGAPIYHESLQFRLIECVQDDNETLSNHILEITNFNETCIKVNKSSSQGDEVFLYIAPQTENGVQLRIKTDNCSEPLSNLHLTVCDETETNENFTELMVTYPFNNISNIDTFNNISDIDTFNNNSNIDTFYDSNQINDDTATTETFAYTGATIYETLHRSNQDSSEEDNYITNAPSNNVLNKTEDLDSSSEEK